MARLDVRKTYKLWIGGAFPRSESGRTWEVGGADGDGVVNVSMASRKDTRDAVVAARKAFGPWSSATAYNRGQILYRAAEMLEGRRDQFVEEVRFATGDDLRTARAEVDAAIDRWVNVAGWSDKLAAVDGAANPVAGPYFDFTLPEPTGVVGVLAPSGSPLLGLVTVIARTIVTGNTCVVVAASDAPTVAISLAEVLATSDVPGGTVNLLTGFADELGPILAGHMDVNAIDLAGAGDDWGELEALAAENLKRVLRPADTDWTVDPAPREMLALTEAKTVWHPRGM
ncbi:aldehyde dehydrogenase family protein [Salsipaludibacter albus]|uniref:aldehyde dehydrogenase family protein n=1 Tax=Salsipaludibacter albus TaxID=2849650 RepID=UPI001EE3C33D|nr:aldehyde dehydrogenase family protein [Salsipaludibacter albus]MBY5164507.1 aldehyde dehydrogenase family protein [Salsipaludibacter albus]